MRQKKQQQTNNKQTNKKPRMFLSGPSGPNDPEAKIVQRYIKYVTHIPKFSSATLFWLYNETFFFK